MNKTTATAPKISAGIWLSLILLGFAGQLAWGVENQFYNTFMYNEITPDPRPISWMVSFTALVSTATAILMGTLSDRTRTRWGRRKPYLVGGYLLWGVFTAIFPASATFNSISMGIFIAILLDSIMSFFGATANDAAFSAYITDITTVTNRGRVSGVLEIVRWVAFLIVYGGAGILIDLIGYSMFFYIIGGVVFIVGLVTMPLIKEGPLPEKETTGYWQQIASTFKMENLRGNRAIFLVLIAITLFATSIQIFFPYLIIYLQHYVKLEALQYSLLVAIAILVGGVMLAYPFGILVDVWGRRQVAIMSVVLEAAGLFLFSISKSLPALVLSGILWLGPMAAWTIATMSWTKDLFPEDKRGQFAGYYLLFNVFIAMIIGPLIGGWLGSSFGIPTVLDGKPGFIPTPLIFQVSAAGTLLALIPLLMIKKDKA